jgi:hypothetical protein
LEPLSQSVSRHLTGLLVKGDDNSVNSIRIELNEGEWHLMEIVETDSKP